MFQVSITLHHPKTVLWKGDHGFLSVFFAVKFLMALDLTTQGL